LVVKEKTAPKISHAHYTSCTQCHVPSVGSQIPTDEIALREPIAVNQFVGLIAPLQGSRAWPTAPPTTPHPTLMRSDCMSCHGPQGMFGLRTPHPDRQACVQCHAPNAGLDQRIFATTLSPVGSP
jgi:nitrate reductase (cytochrome), electron transfer subunit